MKTVIIFDENHLASFMAAACVPQDKDTTMVECKAVKRIQPNDGRVKYVWIGVVPTYLHFPYATTKEVDQQDHVVLLDQREPTPKQSVPLIRTADYVYGIDQAETVATYGNRSLIARAMGYFKVAPNKALFVTNMVEKFYNEDLLSELVLEGVYNATNALMDLRMGNEYVPVAFTPAMMLTMQERFNIVSASISGTVSDGSLLNDVSDKKSGTKHAVRTSFLTSMWWFVFRRVLATKAMAPYYRNISLSATGTVVTCNVMQVNDLIHMNPVFVR